MEAAAARAASRLSDAAGRRAAGAANLFPSTVSRPSRGAGAPATGPSPPRTRRDAVRAEPVPVARATAVVIDITAIIASTSLNMLEYLIVWSRSSTRLSDADRTPRGLGPRGPARRRLPVKAP